MTSDILILLVITLLIMSIVSMVQTFRTLLLNVKALDFLTHVRNVIIEKDDQKELIELEKTDIPILIYYVSGLRSMFYLINLSLFINTVLLMFLFSPVIYGTAIWNIAIWVAAGINSAVIISFRGVAATKQDINTICESYSVLIQSYEFVKEYEGKDDDRAD